MSRTGNAVSTRISALVWPLLTAVMLTGCGAGTADLRKDHGPLQPCDGGPHCVSSQSKNSDRYVPPIQYSGSRRDAQARMLRIVQDMDGAKVVDVQPDYIHATFTSAVFHFVDDVEMIFPSDSKQIQIRSSSRIGYYDFGVNRHRVERIRLAFQSSPG